MIENDFTIVLPSNSSVKWFPDNKTTNYSTKLPREVELNGKWEVGLTEIHIPCTTLHIQKKDARISRESDNEIYFQHGLYDSIPSLIQAINEGLIEYHKNTLIEKLFFDVNGGFVSLKV